MILLERSSFGYLQKRFGNDSSNDKGMNKNDSISSNSNRNNNGSSNDEDVSLIDKENSKSKGSFSTVSSLMYRATKTKSDETVEFFFLCLLLYVNLCQLLLLCFGWLDNTLHTYHIEYLSHRTPAVSQYPHSIVSRFFLSLET